MATQFKHNYREFGSEAITKRVRQMLAFRDQVDVVLIGHSKTFFHYNEKNLSRFLKWTIKQPEII